MKKFLILAVAVFTLASCSSSDEETVLDAIIGTWNIVSTDSCEQQSTLVFNANNSVVFTDFGIGTSGNCTSDVSNGTWANNGNSSYTLTPSDPSDSPVTITISNNTISLGGDTFTKQ